MRRCRLRCRTGSLRDDVQFQVVKRQGRRFVGLVAWSVRVVVVVVTVAGNSRLFVGPWMGWVL